MFGLLLMSFGALAQSESIEPKFSIAISFGFPSSLHVSARDIFGIAGLAVRTDVGGAYLYVFGWLEFAQNFEYHLSRPGNEGLYFGIGVLLYRDLVGQIEIPVTPIYHQFDWKTGVQLYVGLEGEHFFLELGISWIYEFREIGTFAFIPRFLLGYTFTI